MKRNVKGRGIKDKYLGLNPKSFALSSYHCPTCHVAFASNSGLMIFCPACGVIATSDGKVTAAEYGKQPKLITCSTCSSDLYGNVSKRVLSNMFCPECGDKIAKADDDYEVYDEEEDTEGDDFEDTGSEDLEDDEEFDEVDDLDGDYEEPEDADILASVIGESDDSDDSEDSGDEDDSDDSEDDSEDSGDEDDSEDSGDEEDSEDSGDEEDDSGDEEDDSGDEEDDSKAEASALSFKVKKILASPLKDRESVKFDTWQEPNGNIVRNVIISGVPVARIHLSDQEKPEELAKVFASEVYEQTILGQMERKPVKEVLQSAEARLFNFAESKQVPMKTQVKASVNKELNGFRSRFKETFLAVMAGTNKNLFPDVINTLKESLWQSFAECGVNNPESIIEGSFETAAEPFLEQVFDKTIDLMEKGENVRHEIIQMVKDSGTVSLGAHSNDEEDDFRSQLVKASFPLNIGATSVNNDRNSLRGRLQLGKKR